MDTLQTAIVVINMRNIQGNKNWLKLSMSVSQKKRQKTGFV